MAPIDRGFGPVGFPAWDSLKTAFSINYHFATIKTNKTGRRAGRLEKYGKDGHPKKSKERPPGSQAKRSKPPGNEVYFTILFIKTKNQSGVKAFGPSYLNIRAFISVRGFSPVRHDVGG